MAFTRSVWNTLFTCKEAFCTFDDYNYDWSLFHVSKTCLPQTLSALYPTVPRLFHVGKCGFHGHGSDCNISEMLQEIDSINTRAALFPDSVEVIARRLGDEFDANPYGFGHWGDKRDQAFCIGMAESDPMTCLIS